jgi:hypothetical protein
MFAAARHNQAAALEILIAEGDGDVFAVDAEGQTLAHAALQTSDNAEVLVRCARVCVRAFLRFLVSVYGVKSIVRA